MIKICLDAGHFGKYNQSPVNKKYYESLVMWDLHLLLKEELEKYNIQVVTTRENQKEDYELTYRGRAAKGCDLLVSLHSNAAEIPETDYVTAYAAVDGSADEVAKALTEAVGKVLGTKQEPRIEHIMNSSKTADYYGILRGATEVGVPALILEHSFHTNPEITKWLLDNKNLRLLAKAEAETIAKQFLSSPVAQTRYTYLNEIPNEYGFRDIIEDLMNHGYINGDGSDPKGNNDVIDLSHDMVRMLVFLYRGGCFKL